MKKQAEKEQENPRIQCHDCGKWMRLHFSPEKIERDGEVQRFYGGDSYCGHICVFCIKIHEKNGNYQMEKTNCKRSCASLT